MYENFYTALHRHGKDKLHLQFLHEGRYVGSPNLLPLFEQLYNHHFEHTSFDFTRHLIPKKIHQIWLGSDIPDKYVSCMETWADAKGWEYRLWTEPDLEKMSLYNKDLYLLGKNYGEKSDILRLEILYQEGGLYVDVDLECLDIDFFDSLHRTLTFYAGFEPLEHRWLGISNSLLGSSPEHPLLRKMIHGLRPHFLTHEQCWTVIKTGPKYVTGMIENFLNESSHSQICFFPPSYFFPLSGNDIQKENYNVFKESVALHYWSGSWIWGVNNGKPFL